MLFITLDKLYSVIEKGKFPINNKFELIRILGRNQFYIDEHLIDAKRIAAYIPNYPIKSLAEFFKEYFEEKAKAHNFDEIIFYNESEIRAKT